MCWTRSLCCRCPASFPWPQSLAFGRSPRRRRPRAQLNIPCNPWPGYQPLNHVPPPHIRDPHPPPAWATPRHVHFHQSPPPVYVANPPTPVVPMVPFIPAFPSPPQQWVVPQHQCVSPDLCSPRGVFPHLDWDITRFPSSAERCTSPHSKTKATLDGAATFPPTNLITLSFADNPVLGHWERQWGPIFARGQGLHPVTVENVLDAVYQYFNQPLSPADFATTSTHAWGLISDSYRRRLPRSPNLRAVDERRGALRLDVLNGATKFSGLQCIGRDYFQLNLTT
ncbi:hypothetical protein B0H10DRAFT_2054639 [Mycena sp. CBHHK59/15]|nr:hypothetical protein B0H10DRAFT_2054639 [Mycena sp. CBHHK59/15]